MSSSINPPTAPTVPYSFQQHGRTYDDPYAWLEHKDDPNVIAYLEAENAHTRARLGHTDTLQETLYQEMVGRMQEDDDTVPEQRGAYFYYTRMKAGEQYRYFYRRYGLDGEEELLLDENKLAEGLSYCRVFHFEPSPDQNLLAYAVDTTGSWVFTVYVKDLLTGELVAGPFEQTAWSLAWASDNRTLFYTVFNDAHRSYKLLRHSLGSVERVEVFHERDEGYDLSIERTRSGDYMLLTVNSHTTSEVHYLAADTPDAAFTLIHARQQGHEYYVAQHGDRFLIRSNEDALNFRLMTAPTRTPSKENWREILPHDADVLLESVDSFKDFIAIYQRKGGFQQIRLSAPDIVSNVREIPFPEPVYTYSVSANPEFTTTVLRLNYSSPVTPLSVVDYEVSTGTWNIKKQQIIPSGYNPADYACALAYATSHDGAQVPISLVYRKGVARDGANPTLLYGYGSYGISMPAGFDARRFSLIDRGYIYAIAHIRGGSELGRAWYEHGRLMHKMNTFQDFIAAGEYLIAEGYTDTEHLAIMGGSAGGLLVTAVTNMRPDLFKSVVAMVPFTNVITAMLKPELPLTIPEYEQWGNPNDPAAFEYMLSYSPYDNLAAKAYPHVYVKAGLNDLQVPYWDPAKYVARLRTCKTDDNTLLLVTNMGAGHGGASGRYDYLREMAEVYAFLIDTVGVRE